MFFKHTFKLIKNFHYWLGSVAPMDPPWPSQSFPNRNLVSDPRVGISKKKVFVEWIKINGLETFLAARRGKEGRVLKLG